ncbi:MAG: protein kinase family protein [Pseudomonadota bacterium]
MLSPIALLCPQCAAPLPRAARWRTVECSYCGATLMRGEETVRRADFRAAWQRAQAVPAGGGRLLEWRGARYTVRVTLGQGEHSEVLLAERLGPLPERVTLKLARGGASRGMLAREHEVLQALQALQGPGTAYFTRRLPQPIGTGLAQGLADGARDALLLRHPPGYWGSLADVARARPEGIDPRHAVWLWRRMLEVLGFVHAHGWSHGDLSPAHALVHPRDHGVLLIGWGQARHATGAAHATRAARDLRQAAWVVRAVLHGGRDTGTPGVGQHTPAPLADLLRQCSEDAGTAPPQQDAAAAEAALSAAARAAFGAPQFVLFDPDSDPDPAPAGA